MYLNRGVMNIKLEFAAQDIDIVLVDVPSLSPSVFVRCYRLIDWSMSALSSGRWTVYGISLTYLTYLIRVDE